MQLLHQSSMMRMASLGHLGPDYWMKYASGAPEPDISRLSRSPTHVQAHFAVVNCCPRCRLLIETSFSCWKQVVCVNSGHTRILIVFIDPRHLVNFSL